MILTLLAYVVGGHQFTVPASPTAVSGLDMPVNLAGRTGVRGVVNVTTPAAGAQGVVQCTPDNGANYYTLATLSFATAGPAATSLAAGGALDFQSIPVQCRGDVRIRSLLQNGGNQTVRVTYLGLEFQ